MNFRIMWLANSDRHWSCIGTVWYYSSLGNNCWHFHLSTCADERIWPYQPRAMNDQLNNWESTNASYLSCLFTCGRVHDYRPHFFVDRWQMIVINGSCDQSLLMHSYLQLRLKRMIGPIWSLSHMCRMYFCHLFRRLKKLKFHYYLALSICSDSWHSRALQR